MNQIERNRALERLLEVEDEIRRLGDALYLDETGYVVELMQERARLSCLCRGHTAEPPPPRRARWYHRLWHRVGRACGWARPTEEEAFLESQSNQNPQTAPR